MEKLKNKLKDLEDKKKDAELTFHQILGSIVTVNQLIKEYVEEGTTRRKDDKKK